MCLVMKVENTRRSLGTILGRDSIDEVACKGRTHPVSAKRTGRETLSSGEVFSYIAQGTKQFLYFVESLKLEYTIPQKGSTM